MVGINENIGPGFSIKMIRFIASNIIRFSSINLVKSLERLRKKKQKSLFEHLKPVKEEKQKCRKWVFRFWSIRLCFYITTKKHLELIFCFTNFLPATKRLWWSVFCLPYLLLLPSLHHNRNSAALDSPALVDSVSRALFSFLFLSSKIVNVRSFSQWIQIPTKLILFAIHVLVCWRFASIRLFVTYLNSNDQLL